MIAGTSAFLALAAQISESGLTVYVDAKAPAGGDGTTWQTAFQDLQDGFEAVRAVTTFDSPDLIEIRIAGGTYRPDRGTGDRNLRFRLTTGGAPALSVSLLGGFAGLGASDPDVQDFQQTPTILSGDLRGDDGPGFVNRSDNSRVVANADLSAEYVRVEGIGFRGGFLASGESDLPTEAGGFKPYIEPAQPGGWSQIDIVNCAFQDNQSDLDSGAGLRAFCQTVRIWNCSFRNNRSLRGAGGGAMVNASMPNTPGIESCIFETNAASHGGALCLGNRSLEVTRCVFVGNRAEIEGGATIGALNIGNSLFLRNTAGSSGGAVAENGLGFAQITACTFASNGAGAGAAINSYSAGLVARNCIFDNNIATLPSGGAVRVVDSLVPSEISWSLFSEPSSTVQIIGGLATLRGDVFGQNPQFIRPADTNAANSDWPDWNYRFRLGSKAIGIGGTVGGSDLDGRWRSGGDPRKSDAGCYFFSYFTCPANLNRGIDQVVDDIDFQVFVSAYQTVVSPPANSDADFNRDGIVNDEDFALFAAAYDQVWCP